MFAFVEKVNDFFTSLVMGDSCVGAKKRGGGGRVLRPRSGMRRVFASILNSASNVRVMVSNILLVILLCLNSQIEIFDEAPLANLTILILHCLFFCVRALEH
jgi:hypothetical protein